MLIIININRSKKYILPDFKLNFDWKLEVHNLVALLTHSEFRMEMTIWHVQLSNSFWSLVVYCDQLWGAQQNLTFCFKFSNSYVKSWLATAHANLRRLHRSKKNNRKLIVIGQIIGSVKIDSFRSIESIIKSIQFPNFRNESMF